MHLYEMSRHIARIVSGQMRFKIAGEMYFVRNPSRLQYCLAEEIFMEYLEDASLSGAWDEEQTLSFLRKNGIFSDKDEADLKVLVENIDKLKVGLFEMRVRTKEQAKIRIALQKTKVEFERLMILKHSYDHQTSVGLATAAKQRYLLGCSVFDAEGIPYWKDESGWLSPDNILDKIIFLINSNRLGEPDFREIARNDPWKTTWSLQKHCREPIFEGSAVDLSDEQKNLIIWSCVYDTVREHPDNLDDEIIEDDDMLDGWMIVKKNERDKSKVSLPTVGNEKIKNATEQFHMVDTIEDARRVIGQNDEMTQYTVKQRMDLIKKEGVVSEVNMPDTALSLRQQRQEKFMQQYRK